MGYRDSFGTRDRRALVATAEWVMDGNFAETFDLRMPRADTLVWLDYPRRPASVASCARHQDYGKQPPDLPDGCPETFDLGVLRFAWGFPAVSRPQIAPAIERFGRHLRVFRLTTIGICQTSPRARTA